MWDEHRIDPTGERTQEKPKQPSIKEAMQKAATIQGVVDPGVFHEAQLRLIVRRRLPFNAVTWDEYQELLILLNPHIEPYLISSHSTIAAHLSRSFARHQETIRTTLSTARSLIHFGIDTWTAPNRRCHMAICAQFVDANYKLKKVLLGLPQLRYRHGGEFQSRLLFDSLRTYDVARKIGYVVGDNHQGNDKCLKHLSTSLDAEYQHEFNPKQRRIRCIAHVINLALEAFMFAKNKTALSAVLDLTFENEDPDVDPSIAATLQDQLSANTGRGSLTEQGWRSIGPLGKLHNLAVALRNSTQLQDYWKNISPRLLGIDNATRWNSWYKLINRALGMKSELVRFCVEYDRFECIHDNALMADDWKQLQLTADFLNPFYRATMENQSDFSSLDQSLYTLDLLLKFCEKSLVSYIKAPYLPLL